MAEGYNMRSPAVKRLMRESLELKDKNEQFFAQPLEDNLFEWHFTIRGPGDSEFEGGIYHGRIILPAEYPMKPPSIILLTPSGRFETGKKICLSISGYHPETWQPSWSLRTALLAIIGFMTTHGNGAIGSLDYSPEERKILAKKSQDWKCQQCGSICDLVLPVTEASQMLAKEAKELGAQINLQGEKPKTNDDRKENVSESNNQDNLPPNNSTKEQNASTASFPTFPFNNMQFPPQFAPQFTTQFTPQFTPQINGNPAQNYNAFYPHYPIFNPMFGFPPRPQPNGQPGIFPPFPQFPPFFQNTFPSNVNQQFAANFSQSDSGNVSSRIAEVPTEVKNINPTCSKNETAAGCSKNAPGTSAESSATTTKTNEVTSTTDEQTAGRSPQSEIKSANQDSVHKVKAVAETTPQTSQQPSTSAHVDSQQQKNSQEPVVEGGASGSSETSNQTEAQMTRAASAQALLQGLRQRLVVPPTDTPRPATTNQPVRRSRFLSLLATACLDSVVAICVVCIALLMIRRMYLTITEVE